MLQEDARSKIWHMRKLICRWTKFVILRVSLYN